MSKTAAVFNKKKFINEVTETVRHMYRKQLKEASQQEIFQAVSYVVKDVVIDDWLATQQAFDDQDPKIVYYMSMEFLMGRAPVRRMPTQAVFEPLVTAPQVSVSSRVVYILRRLIAGGAARMSQLFARSQSRSTNVATFLALLELVRGGRIALDDRGALTMRRTRPERNKENP